MQIMEALTKFYYFIPEMYNDIPIITIMMAGGFFGICDMVLAAMIYPFIPKKIKDEVLDGGMFKDENKMAPARFVHNSSLFIGKISIPGVLGHVIILSKIPFIRRWFHKRAEEKEKTGKKFMFFLYFEDNLTPLPVKIICIIIQIIFLFTFFLIGIGGIGVLLEKTGVVPLETLNTYFRF